MRSKIILHSLTWGCLVFLLLGCAGSMPKTQMHFGIKAAQSNLWNEAIFRWKRVLEDNPNSAAAHNNLAVAYEKQGLLEEAEKEYEAAIRIAPNNKYVQSNYDNFKRRARNMKEEKDEKK